MIKEALVMDTGTSLLIKNVLFNVEPLSANTTISEVGDQLTGNESYKDLLSLPVVENGRPIGVISRYQIMNVLMRQFGRELFGRKPVSQFMNTSPLIIDANESMEKAARLITDNIVFPITEDFIIVENQCFAGIGMVVDVLRAMQLQLQHRNTDLDKAYKHLKESQTQLIQSEKMASLGQMVAGVAHEINTPLGYVQNNVEVFGDITEQTTHLIKNYKQLIETLTINNSDPGQLEKILEEITELHDALYDEEGSEDVKNLIEDTRYGIEQITELVMNLKNFSRLDKAKVDNTDINECIDSALLIGRNAIKHKAEIIKQYSTLPAISCSPSQINQVFLNLLTNAAQAIDTNGKILIKTYNDDQYVNITIEDNGCGIAQDTLPKIFDPFFTTKEIGKGTGMGLSICYKIIKQHGGSIHAVSKVGIGTKFLIKLPCQQVEIKQAS